jgi:hypothetical protein
MKRLILSIALLLGVIAAPLALSASVSAQDVFGGACDGAGKDSSVCQSRDTSNPIAGKNGLLYKTVRIISYIAGIAAVIVIIVGGLNYITSNGDTNKVNTGKDMIIYASIGLVVIVLAQSIITFIVNRIG